MNGIRRNIVLSADLWDRCMARAKSRGQTLSGVIRKLLEMWLAGQFDF